MQGMGYYVGNRGFTCAWWSPEYHGGHFTLFQGCAEDTALASQVFLPYQLVK
jgi:hypothetical protein